MFFDDNDYCHPKDHHFNAGHVKTIFATLAALLLTTCSMMVGAKKPISPESPPSQSDLGYK